MSKIKLIDFVRSGVVFAFATACGCASDIPRDEDYWLEVARVHAISHCVPFYDETYGEYQIAVSEEEILYEGDLKLHTFAGGTEIRMSHDEDLISLHSGNVRVFPRPNFRVKSEDEWCYWYSERHDEQGLLRSEYRSEYPTDSCLDD